MPSPLRWLLVAGIAAGAVLGTAPLAHAEEVITLRLTADGLRVLSPAPSLDVADWRPGTSRDIDIRLDNGTVSTASVSVGVTDVAQRSGLADALRLSTTEPAWTGPLTGTGAHRVLDARSGASEDTELRLWLPAETGNEVQGGSASFTLRFVARWAGGSANAAVPFGPGPEGPALAFTGRDLGMLLGAGLALVLAGVGARYLAGRTTITKSQTTSSSSHRSGVFVQCSSNVE